MQVIILYDILVVNSGNKMKQFKYMHTDVVIDYLKVTIKFFFFKL